jgi:hypothetical protein
MPIVVVDVVRIQQGYVQGPALRPKTERKDVVSGQQAHRQQHHRPQVLPRFQSRAQLQQVVLLSTPQERRTSGMEKGYSLLEDSVLAQQTVLLHVVLDLPVFVQGWVLNSKLARQAAALFPEARLEVHPPLPLHRRHHRLPRLRTL